MAARPTILRAAVAVSLFATPGWAAVVLEQEFRSDGFGGFGAMTGTVRSTVEADRARTETSSEFTGKLLRRFTGETTSIEIARLDRGVMLHLNPGNGTYTETSFADLRRQREEALRKLESEAAKRKAGSAGASPGAPAGMRFSPPEIETRRTGAKDTVAGIPVEQVVVTARTTGTVEDSSQRCDVTWTMDLWAGNPPGRAILEQYHAALAAALGFGAEETRLLGEQVAAGLASFGDGMQKLQEAMRDLDGVPLRSRLTLEVGGECGIAGVAPGSAPEEPEAGETEEQGGGGMLGRMRKSMSKRFKRDKGSDADPATDEGGAPPAAPPTGPRQVFGMTHETTRHVVEDAPPGTFDPPASFKNKGSRVD